MTLYFVIKYHILHTHPLLIRIWVYVHLPLITIDTITLLKIKHTIEAVIVSLLKIYTLRIYRSNCGKLELFIHRALIYCNKSEFIWGHILITPILKPHQ